MANRPLPTPDEIRQLLRYDPDTGKFVWLHRPIETFLYCAEATRRRTFLQWNGVWPNKEAGSINADGYVVLSLMGRHVRAHLVVWAITFDRWPTMQIDHINGNRADNRLANLREVSHGENQRNAHLGKNNTSGASGVYFCKRSRKWRAAFACEGRVYNLGRFPTVEEASSIVETKRRELGIPERHGKPREMRILSSG